MLKLVCNFWSGTVEGNRIFFVQGDFMLSESCRVCYDRLWELLSSRKMKKKDLQFLTNLSSAVIAKLGKDLPVHLNTLIKICSALQCSLSDIVEVKTALPERV